MAVKSASRRRLLVALCTAAALSPAGFWRMFGASAARAQGLPESDQAGGTVLPAVARRLFPHAQLADSVYLEIIDDLLDAASADPLFNDLLSDGERELTRAAGGDFLALDAAAQIEVLTAVEKRPFFEPLRVAVRDRLYAHPALWEVIGYPGSSVEFGGYVDRGFDDIDWLPED